MEGRLLARARAKQETLRAENRAEEDRREIAAKIPEIGRIDTALCANLSEMVRVAMRQSARTAQELEKESLALQEKRSALLVQNGYPKDYLDPIYSCPRCRDTGWTDGRICECVQKLYRAEQTRELAPLLKQGDETFENFRLDYYSPVAPASGVSPRAQMERVLTGTTASLGEMIEKSKEPIGAFYETVRRFNDNVRDFSTINYDLRGNIERLDLCMRDMSRALRESTKQLSGADRGGRA